MADYMNYQGQRFGQFSPEGSAFLREQAGDQWPDMRQSIAEARTGKGRGPAATDFDSYAGMDPKTRLLLMFLLGGASDQNIRPGTGARRGDSITYPVGPRPAPRKDPLITDAEGASGRKYDY